MSLAIAALRPNASFGEYPERPAPRTEALERLFGAARHRWTPAAVRPAALQRFVRLVREHGLSFSRLTLPALQAHLPALRERMLREGFTAEAVAPIFALLREAAHHTIGKRPFDVQVMGGWVMLNGFIAEMQTGEGKSLTAILPACTAALAHIPVHIVTVNDYLVERDAAHFQPLYKAAGLSVGSISDKIDGAARRAVYQRDIVYCSNKQLVFDYLKDRLTLSHRPSNSIAMQSLLHGESVTQRLLMRGLCFAIVDEADSVLIDDARTPLILSASGLLGEQATLYRDALQIAATLHAGSDYNIDTAARHATLTERGRARIETLAVRFPPPWSARLQREYLVAQALAALHLYRREQHYLVIKDKVVIIDLNTGRVMPDRKWEHGLHQLIEAKERCPISLPQEAVAKISFQRFFPRYLRLAGMTGTAEEVRRELWDTYQLGVVRIPTRRPSRRHSAGLKIYASEEAKLNAIIASVQRMYAHGRPVLIGTTTVAHSEAVSKRLSDLGLRHQVLNARMPHHEAAIIAAAGKAGRITVATNMAGRGTDIVLGPGVDARGGLHVISFEPNCARRIDRQLGGRCARQGDRGSYEAFGALTDEVLTHALPKRLLQWLAQRYRGGRPLPARLGAWLAERAQRIVERRDRLARSAVRAQDEAAARQLSFTGRSE